MTVVPTGKLILQVYKAVLSCNEIVFYNNVGFSDFVCLFDSMVLHCSICKGLMTSMLYDIFWIGIKMCVCVCVYIYIHTHTHKSIMNCWEYITDTVTDFNLLN